MIRLKIPFYDVPIRQIMKHKQKENEIWKNFKMIKKLLMYINQIQENMEELSEVESMKDTFAHNLHNLKRTPLIICAKFTYSHRKSMEYKAKILNTN